MFKSIQYIAYLYIIGIIVSVAGFTYCITQKEYGWGIVAGILLLFCLNGLNNNYKKYNKNIVFLLNALDNGDYSFHFSETKLSTREKELNTMLNWVKDILSNARREVIENEKYLSIILESVSTGIIIIDERGIVHSLNKAALSILGLSNFTHINQLKFINDSLPERFHRLKEGDRIQVQIPNEREEQQISAHTSGITLKKGRMRIITLNNIGNELEGKEMESWIKLIRVMTHEIMNSIAPINSLSETLLQTLHNKNSRMKEEELKENTLEAFETINTTAKGLLSFVESYRKFTGIPQPKKKKIQLKDFIDKNVKLIEASVNEKEIVLNVSLQEENQVLEADESLINQVLVNLLKNALEAVNPLRGEISISVYTTERDKVRIDVVNNGEKIPADVLPHIFVPFFTTKSEGSGIGLSVSRYIMRLHEGKLMHSLSNKGETTFSMIF